MLLHPFLTNELKHIANLVIREAVYTEAAFKSRCHLFHIILKTAQTADAAFVHLFIFTQNPNR